MGYKYIGCPGGPIGLDTKKTEISAQHEFLTPIHGCVCRGIVLIYLDVHQKC